MSKEWTVEFTASGKLKDTLNKLTQQGRNIFQVVIASQEPGACYFNVIAWRD